MWKKIDGELIHTTDPSRARFKTYINKDQLNYLKQLAESEDTHVSYLLENGLKHLLADPNFTFDKNNRLKDKTEFRTTCDKTILENAKALAKKHKLHFTDIVQASINYINISEVKKRNWKHRYE